MKNKLVKTLLIIIFLFTVIFAIAYNIFEFNGKNIFDTKLNPFSEINKKDSNNIVSILSKI